MSKKLPYFNFFPGDWIKDTRILSLEAKAIWIDLLCLMHDSDRRGHLTRAGTPISIEQVAKFCCCSFETASRAIQELISFGIVSCAGQEKVLYSRRMVRDEKKRRMCSDAGKRGGNPAFKDPENNSWYQSIGYVYAIRRESDGAIKIGGSVNPKRRKSGAHGSLRGEETEIVLTWTVVAMGAAERLLHERFKDKCIGGEWFILTEEDIKGVESFLFENDLIPKEHSKGTPKPPLVLECGNGIENGSFPRKRKKGGVGGEGEGFAEFWKAYPKKVGKQDAIQAWNKLAPSEDLRAVLLQALERQKRWPGWLKDKGQYIPHPATWLNRKRWEDQEADIVQDDPWKIYEEPPGAAAE